MAWLLVPATIVEPPLCRFIKTCLGWCWIFYLNLPVGLMGIALALSFIDNTREEGQGAFDLRVYLLSGLAPGCLLFKFDMASRPGEGEAIT